MSQIDVALERNSYPIYVGASLLDDTQLLNSLVSGSQVLIVTNETIAPLYLAKVKNVYESKQCDVIILPDGEQYKNLIELNKIFDVLLTHKHSRSTTLLALGGGVVGDMTGFAAACYMRGVNYVQMPTTLLAQVDAAIGGKTAVNHSLGKNMIGAFHQPKAVVADSKVLQTLSSRAFTEGMAEVIKYGLIQDAEFFSWLEKNMDKLLQRDPMMLQHAIERSCAIKAGIVVADEREQNVRAFLNFGHTFAHAIENGLGYGKWLHGEAVAVGMLIASDLSAQMGWIKSEEVERLKNLLLKIDLPVTLPAELTSSQLLELMQRDKKNVHGRIRLVLLQAIGEALVSEDVSQKMLQQTLERYKRSI